MFAENDNPNNNLIRINRIYLKKIKKIWLETTIETEETITIAEVINAIINKHIDSTTTKDVIKYRNEILGKN